MRTPKTKNIRTAVIGVGNMGKHHARVYSELSNLVAVSDLSVVLGKDIAKKYDTKYYRDYHKMINSEEIDALSIVVPTKYHRDVAIDCLKKKINILVEKPISDNSNEADEIFSEATHNNCYLMVGHIERFNPAISKLKDLIDKQRFGSIISLLAIRVGVQPPMTRDSDVVFDLSIHDVDIFNYLLNSYPQEKKVFRQKVYNQNLSDVSGILLKYKTAIGVIQTNWITPIKMRKLFVTGTEGFAELDYISQKLIVYDKMVDIKPAGNFFEVVTMYESPKKEVYISKKEPLKEEIKHFLKNLESTDLTLAKDAVNAVKILNYE